jgi:thiamine-monophosphate kinase
MPSTKALVYTPHDRFGSVVNSPSSAPVNHASARRHCALQRAFTISHTRDEPSASLSVASPLARLSMTEAEWIAALRTLPLHPGARDLRDDAALLDAAPLVVTTDTLVEGVHFLPHDAAADVAWKLLATNLSDLAAKGALVEGVLLNYPLRDDGWDRAFLAGFGDALAHFCAALIGGDTVSLPAAAPRVLTLTAFGRDARAPSRTGARAGDGLWVTGTIGDAGAGLALAQSEAGTRAGLALAQSEAGKRAGLTLALRGTDEADDVPAAQQSADASASHCLAPVPTDAHAHLLAAYRRPQPRLADGRALASYVHAMMDVSDGLLIDAGRHATASGLAVRIDLAAVPLSPAYRAFAGQDRAARLAAATAGDDYQLLFAAPADAMPPVAATRVGTLSAGAGLSLHDAGEPVALPFHLGFQHAGA